jgi:hypothetical protein
MINVMGEANYKAMSYGHRRYLDEGHSVTNDQLAEQ